MLAKRPNPNRAQAPVGFKILRRIAWGILGGLWVFILFLMANHWLVEVPATRAIYAAGLEQGFDSLAGIVASCDPKWENVRRINGRNVGSRLNRMHGDTMFSVWLDQDEIPGWHSGLASLRFDKQGRLIWARRYFRSDPPLMAVTPNTGESFPVVQPRLDLRSPAQAMPAMPKAQRALP